MAALIRFLDSRATMVFTHDRGDVSHSRVSAFDGSPVHIIDLADDLPNGNGASLHIEQPGCAPRDTHGVLWLDRTNPVTGSALFDEDVITLAPAVTAAHVRQTARAITVEGNRFLDLDTRDEWRWGMMTGFCDFQLFLRRNPLVFDLWAQARDLGANGRRVFGMMAYITRFEITTPEYFERLLEFFDALARYDLQCEFTVFTDAQVLMPTRDDQRRHWDWMLTLLPQAPNAIVSAVNEYQKNGVNPADLSAPNGSVVCSPGSSISDTAPPLIGAWPNSYREWHGRRDGKVWLSTDDMWYVGNGIEEGRGQYAPSAPVVHNEPIGAAEVDVPGRRSTNPRLFESLALSSIALGNGATFHCEDALYGRLLGPVQQQCARAFYNALWR